MLTYKEEKIKPKSRWFLGQGRDKTEKIINLRETLLLVSVFFFLMPSLAQSEVRTSENYRLFADTLSSGGDYSTSTNYRVWDTIGEVASDENTTSTNFRTRLGFQALVPDDLLTVTFSRDSINLGDISPSGVSEQELVISYVTNANGFTTTVSEDGNLRASSGDDINDVSDGSITAGSEEYGIRTSGSMGQQNDADTSITSSSKTIVSRSDPTTSASAALTFKAAVSASTPDGNYSHTVTISTSGNF